MKGLGKSLREKAALLGLSDSEVARRLGISQARYHNYVADVAEPDLGTLVRICRVLAASPDELLAFNDGGVSPSEGDILRQRIASAMQALDGDALAYTADLLDAFVTSRGRQTAGSAGKQSLKSPRVSGKPGAKSKTQAVS